MILALRVLGSALRQVGAHLTIAFISNVCAVLISVPLLLLLSAVAHATSLSVLPLGVVLLLGVLPSPALAGLQLLGDAFTQADTISVREQWKGIIHYWQLSLRAWLTGILVTGIMLLNVVFYPQLGSSHSGLRVVAGPLEVVWLSVVMFWLAMHLYVYPLLLRQDRPSIVLAYRNAAVMVLGRPLYSFIISLVWLVWLAITATTGPAYLIGLIVAATIQQNALARAVSTYSTPDSAAN